MGNSKLLILGAGGHGKVVADAAVEAGIWREMKFLDDVATKNVVGSIKSLPNFSTAEFDVVVAIGDNKIRKTLIDWAKELGFNIATVIHPTAFVSKSSKIGYGTVIFANSVVNACASIGYGCIINTGSIVEHDCSIGDAAHICPNATLAGGAKIGNSTRVGMNSCVIEKTVVGKNVIIGAGSSVINDIEDNVTAVGVPAKIIKKNI
jgi:UDP-N-acetylbacillosamine N-acetyltransferase